MAKKNKLPKNELQATIRNGSRALEKAKLKRIAKPLKVLLWDEAKVNNITHKTENLLTQIINVTLGSLNTENEFDKLLRESESSYQTTHSLFQKGSLKERFGSLVGNNFQTQSSRLNIEQLNQEERKWLNEVKKIYKKYKVCSIYRKNLNKQVKKGHVEQLLRKGYLREINVGILTLVS